MLCGKVVYFVGEADKRVIKQCLRYCCRLCGSDGINLLFRLQPKLSSTQRDGVRLLKEWLDWSCVRNTIHRAMWMLCTYRRPAYRVTARRTGLDPDELRLLYSLLGKTDRRSLADTPEPKKFSEAEVVAVVTALQTHIHRTVRRRLRYVYENDRGLSKEDFWGELQCQAVKIVRNYEVLGLSVDEMIPLAAQGITNHATNLAIFHGKDRRNPLQRVTTRNDTRLAWYCNVNAELVEHVCIHTTPKYRRGDYCLASFKKREPCYIYIGRLYDTRTDAIEALKRYRRGLPAKRSIAIDLSGSIQDDWQPTTTSLETPSSDEGTPLIHCLPAPEEEPCVNALIEDYSQKITDPRARMFFEVLRGDLSPLFDPFCVETTGRSSTELSEYTLGQVARRYCGISLKELTTLVPASA